MDKKKLKFIKKSTLRNVVDWQFGKVHESMYSNSKIARIANRNLKSYRSTLDPDEYVKLFHNEYHRLWLILNQVQQLPEATRLEKLENPETYRSMTDKFNYDRMGDAVTKAFDNFMGPGQLDTDIAFSFINDIIKDQQQKEVTYNDNDKVVVVDTGSNMYSIYSAKDVAGVFGGESSELKSGRTKSGLHIFKMPTDYNDIIKLKIIGRYDPNGDMLDKLKSKEKKQLEVEEDDETEDGDEDEDDDDFVEVTDPVKE